MIRRWDFKDLDAPRPHVFAAIDPGEHGATAIFAVGMRDPLEVLPTAEQPETLCRCFERYGVRHVVTESLFVGLGAQAAMNLAASLWMVIGWVGRHFGGELDIIECHPSTWKAWVKRQNGWKDVTEKQQGKMRRDALGDVLEPYSSRKADGVSDAIYIGRAFLSLYP